MINIWDKEHANLVHILNVSVYPANIWTKVFSNLKFKKNNN